MTTIIREDEMTVIDSTVDPPVIVFNTEEKLFHCTNLVSGSITLPARTGRLQNGTTHFPSNLNNFHTLAAVHANADIVLGGFKVTTFGSNQGIAGLGVFDAGGSYVHVQMEGNTMAVYTFSASGGQLRLNERVLVAVGKDGTNITRTRTLLSVQIDYKLYVGTLT